MTKTKLCVVLLLMPLAVARSAGGARAASSVYVADYGANDVAQFEISTGGGLSPLAAARAASGAGPQAVVVSPDGTSVYLTDTDAGSVSQFDASAGGVLSPKSAASTPARP